MHLDGAEGKRAAHSVSGLGGRVGSGERSRRAFTVTLPGSSLVLILMNHSSSCASPVQTCYAESPKQADFAFHCSDHHRDY